MEAYGFDPFAISRAGYTRFETLRHLFHCAEQSARYHLSSACDKAEQMS